MYDDDANDLNDPYDYDLLGPADDAGGDWFEATPRRARGLAVGRNLWIALLVGALVIGGGAGLFYLFRQTTASPVDTTRSFYEALNRRDFEAAVAYIDPSNGISAAVFQNSENLINIILELLTGAVLEEFDIQIPDLLFDVIGDIQWEFRDMTYALASESGDRATVQVDGQLHLSVLGFEVPTPLSITHELVRIDGKWYINLGF